MSANRIIVISKPQRLTSILREEILSIVNGRPTLILFANDVTEIRGIKMVQYYFVFDTKVFPEAKRIRDHAKGQLEHNAEELINSVAIISTAAVPPDESYMHTMAKIISQISDQEGHETWTAIS